MADTIATARRHFHGLPLRGAPYRTQPKNKSRYCATHLKVIATDCGVQDALAKLQLTSQAQRPRTDSDGDGDSDGDDSKNSACETGDDDGDDSEHANSDSEVCVPCGVRMEEG